MNIEEHELMFILLKDLLDAYEVIGGSHGS
jgi:hypothetical protein